MQIALAFQHSTTPKLHYPPAPPLLIPYAPPSHFSHVSHRSHHLFSRLPERSTGTQSPGHDYFPGTKKTWTTSVTLKISVADTNDIWSFSLSRNDSSVGSYMVTGVDTVIVDNGLTPDREYRYRAYWLDDGLVKDSSNEVIAITMDTTSHNFIWTIDTLGNYSSYLKDVAIVDENNIWVVGNIETDNGEYNAAHWDGVEWELMGIYSNTLDLYSIFYFSENDIWVLSRATCNIQKTRYYFS